MKVNVTSAYGNFALNVEITTGIHTEDVDDCTKKLIRLGLASELYRVGNGAIDKVFAPKRANKDGKLVPDLKEFKRESVAYGAENAEKVKAALVKALAYDEDKNPEGYEGLVVTVSEKQRGEKAAEMKRATDLFEKAERDGKLDGLAMLIGWEGESDDRAGMIPAIHQYLNPKA